MKRFAIVTTCILLFCAGVFYAVSLPHHVSVATATGGALDLTRADFADSMVALDGEWEFYYEKFYAPDDFAVGAPEGGAIIEVPQSWEGAGYPLTGYATYRLTVETMAENLTLYLPTIVPAAKVWVNGEVIYEAGVPGKTEGETSVGRTNTFAAVRPLDGKLEIVVWAANYEWMEAGMKHSLMLGDQSAVQSAILTRGLLLSVFLGGLIMLGVYHLFLYFSHEKDAVYLIFALFCLNAVVRFVFESNSIAVLYWQVGAWSQYVYMAALVMTCGLLAAYTHAVFHIPYNKPLIAVYALTTIGLAALPFFVPFSSLGESIFLLSLVPLIVSWVLALCKKSLSKGPYDILYLIAMPLFTVWGPLNKVLLNDKYFVPGVAAHMFLVISQCVMLALGYAEAKRRQEELAMETEFYHRMAHNIRTPLTKISTNIQVANMGEATDHERLVKSQQEIMKIAGMIDSAMDHESEAGK